MLVDIENDCFTELSWVPSFRRRETIALWIDHWYNGERKPAIRDILAADSAIVFNHRYEEVLICDVFAVDSRLDWCHHEHVLWRTILLDSLLPFLTTDFVLDLGQVKFHRNDFLFCIGFWSICFLIDQSMRLEVILAICPNSKPLLNHEWNFFDIAVALGIVDSEESLGGFIWQIDIFLIFSF